MFLAAVTDPPQILAWNFFWLPNDHPEIQKPGVVLRILPGPLARGFRLHHADEIQRARSR